MTELTRGKSLVVLAIVVGCFAILWPRIFYPMFQGPVAPTTTTTAPTHPPFRDRQPGPLCCGLVFENDVSSAAFLAELCRAVLKRGDQSESLAIQLTEPVFNDCRRDLLEKCGIDLDDVIKSDVDGAVADRRVAIKFHGKVRARNLTTCLLANYDIDENLVRAKKSYHRPQDIFYPRHMRPERPPHLHPDGVHPALREKGRVIPPARTIEKQAKPGPMPGMRPPMGAGGHVVSQPSGTGSMGILMPIYTIGIVVFFVYTLMKIMFKKQPESTEPRIKDFHMDPEHRKYVFAEEYCRVPGPDGRPADMHVKEFALLQEQQRLIQLEQQMRRSRSRTPPENFAKKEERVEDLKTIPEHVCTHHHTEEVAADAQTVESAPIDEPTRDEPKVVDEEPTIKAEAAPVEVQEPVQEKTEAQEPVQVEETIQAQESAQVGEEITEAQEAAVEAERVLQEEKDEDEEVDQLRRRLEETEKAMERICRQMGNVTDKLLPTAVAELFTPQLQEAEKEVEASVVEELVQATEITQQEAVVEQPKKEEPEWDNVLAKVEESFRRFSRDIGQPAVQVETEEPAQLTDEQAIAACLKEDEEVKPTSFAEMIAKAHEEDLAVEEEIVSSTVADVQFSEPKSTAVEVEQSEPVKSSDENIYEEVSTCQVVEEQAPVVEELTTEVIEETVLESSSSSEVVEEEIAVADEAQQVESVEGSVLEKSLSVEDVREQTPVVVDDAVPESDLSNEVVEEPVVEEVCQIEDATQQMAEKEELSYVSEVNEEDASIQQSVTEVADLSSVEECIIESPANGDAQLDSMLQSEALKVIESIEENGESEKNVEQSSEVSQAPVELSSSVPVEDGSVQEPTTVTEDAVELSSCSPVKECSVIQETTVVAEEVEETSSSTPVEEDIAQEPTTVTEDQVEISSSSPVEDGSIQEPTTVSEDLVELSSSTPVEECSVEEPTTVTEDLVEASSPSSVEDGSAQEPTTVTEDPAELSSSSPVEETIVQDATAVTEYLVGPSSSSPVEESSVQEAAAVTEDLVEPSSSSPVEESSVQEPTTVTEEPVVEAGLCSEVSSVQESTCETAEVTSDVTEVAVDSFSTEESTVQQATSDVVDSSPTIDDSVADASIQETTLDELKPVEDGTVAPSEVADEATVTEVTETSEVESGIASVQELTVADESVAEVASVETNTNVEEFSAQEASAPCESSPVNEQSTIQESETEVIDEQPAPAEPEEVPLSSAETSPATDADQKQSEVIETPIHPEVARCVLSEQPRPGSEERKLIVCGMELTAEMEDHGKMPAGLLPRVTPDRHHPKSDSDLFESEHVPSVLLETVIPAESHLVVSEAECSAQVVPPEQLDLDETEYESSPVVLSGKMTLSVIGMELTAEAPDVHAESYTIEEPESHRSVRFPEQPTDKVYLIPSEPDEEISEVTDEAPRSTEIDELEDPLEDKVIYRPPTPPLQHLDEEGTNVEFLTYEQLEEAGEIAEVESTEQFYATSAAEAVQNEIQESYEAVTNFTSSAQPFFVDSGLEPVAEEPEELEKPEEASREQENLLQTIEQDIETHGNLLGSETDIVPEVSPSSETETALNVSGGESSEAAETEIFTQEPFEHVEDGPLPTSDVAELALSHTSENPTDCDSENVMETAELPAISLPQAVENADAVSQSLADRILMDVEYQVLPTSESSSSVGTRRESNDSATVQDVSKAEDGDFESNRELPEIEHALEQAENNKTVVSEAEPSISSFIIREDYPDEDVVQAMTEDEILQARKEIEAIKKLLADVTTTVTETSETAPGASDDQTNIVNELAHAMADDGVPATASKGSSPDMDEFEVIRSPEGTSVENLGSKLPPTSES